MKETVTWPYLERSVLELVVKFKGLWTREKKSCSSNTLW